MNMLKTTATSVALLLLATAAPALADSSAPVDAELISLKMIDVSARHTLPAQITVEGKVITADKQPVVKENTLYVPLRFIVEAAGGTVAWDGATQTVTATMKDRTAIFVIGQDQAEMNKRGVFYITRNMIKMDKPVAIIEGRTMVSADALTNILGLMEREDADANLDLVNPDGAGDTSIEVVPTAIAYTAAPEELRAWAQALPVESGPSYKVVTTTDGRFLAIAGGTRPTGGYTIEIVGAGRLGDGTWVVEATVVKPTGMVTQMVTNPVGYFQLAGMTGKVEVHFAADTAPANG
jgi:hypothetical protein